MAQRRYLAREILQQLERQDTHFAVLECNCLGRASIVADAIEADDIAGQVVPGDLFAPILAEHQCLEGSQPYRIQRPEAIPGTVNGVLALEAQPDGDEVVEALAGLRREAEGEAKPVQRARDTVRPAVWSPTTVDPPDVPACSVSARAKAP